MNHSFDPEAMEILLGMTEADIRTAAQTLLDRHATELPRFIAAPWDDYDLIFRANGSALLVLRLWAEMVPPFRHAIVHIQLVFDEGYVAAIDSISRESLGA
jgi:hypothetical protein